MKILVLYNGNWADEMDLQGFIIIDKDIWKRHLERVKEFFTNVREFSVSVGTNKMVDYASYKYYASHFRTKELSEELGATLISLFGTKYGVFPAIRREYMWEYPEPSDTDNEF